MAAKKYLARVSGVTKQESAIDKSTGATDAGKMIAAGTDGKLDESFLPTGIGADTVSVVASEALAAGDFVNRHVDGGVIKVRKADNSNGRWASGFVKEAVSISETATIYPLDSVNAEKTGLTVGECWLGTAGGIINTPLDAEDPSNAGKICQRIGDVISATEIATDDYGYVIL